MDMVIDKNEWMVSHEKNKINYAEQIDEDGEMMKENISMFNSNGMWGLESEIWLED